MMALLAIDDDQPSRRAAYAAARWLPAGCHVVALHVGPTVASLAAVPPPGVGMAGVGYTTHLASALPADAELEATAQTVARTALEAHPGSVRVERGDPASMICQVADEIAADLIVVGTGDRGWLGRLVNPSVSSSVAGHAPCSVLIVRPDAVEDR
jgi:nucleotide-binding universal stress UspA family protein